MLTARHASCVSAINFAAKCALPARCCVINSSFCLRAGFDAFEVVKDADAQAFKDAVRRYSVFYQPAADGQLTAFRRRVVARKLENTVEQVR